MNFSKAAHRFILSLFSALASVSLLPAQEIDDDMPVLELAPLEVFSNSMKMVDGTTGKEYTGEHPVVLGFRRDFDNILVRFHKRLLNTEYTNIKKRSETIEPYSNDLAELVTSFGLGDFEVHGPHLVREIAIFRRMVKDPFFRIKELVVWDLQELRRNPNALSNRKYGKDIRYNEETGQWERRITTQWDVAYIRSNARASQFFTYKEQGLNLDTNKGYHLIDRGLPGDIVPSAFKEVALSYPIIFDPYGDVEDQIHKLKLDFVENLYYIYDPFSWVARGNVRFRRGFANQLHSHLAEQRLSVTNRDWLNRVLANLFDDIVMIKYWGPDEIYDHQMLSSLRKNRNILGEDLDLLNWHRKEKRKVNYDPDQPHRVPRINFDNAGSARYILLDAYRRYSDRFVDALRQRILNLEEKADAKELVKDALAEVSGVPADKYIPAAIKVQQAELARFLRE